MADPGLEARLRAMMINNVHSSNMLYPQPIYFEPQHQQPFHSWHFGAQLEASPLSPQASLLNVKNVPPATSQAASHQTGSQASNHLSPSQSPTRAMRAHMAIPLDPPFSAHPFSLQSSVQYSHHHWPPFHPHHPSPSQPVLLPQQLHHPQQPYIPILPPNQFPSTAAPPQNSHCHYCQSSTSNSPFPTPHASDLPPPTPCIHHQHQTQNHGQRFDKPESQLGRAPARQSHRRQPSPTSVAEASFLDRVWDYVVARVEPNADHGEQRELFRSRLERICANAIVAFEHAHGNIQCTPNSISLSTFGSVASGFATQSADMDLGLLSPMSNIPPDVPGSPIPRVIEAALVREGLGVRLLNRTRVPIIKICKAPSVQLLTLLADDRFKRDQLPEPSATTVIDEPTTGTTDKSSAQFDHHHHRSSSPDLSAATCLTLLPAQGPVGRPHSLEPSKTRRRSEKDVLASIKQPQNTSLASYYNMVRGHLRALGGRDLAISSRAQLSEAQCKLLNRFALAFVQGLRDEKFKRRLLDYESLKPDNLASLPATTCRSLQGVYAQIEGEMLAGLLDTREIGEVDATAENELMAIIRAWRDLQNMVIQTVDPILYAKDLQAGVEKLKRMPSLAVACLVQEPFESPTDYHARASKLLVQLGGIDAPGNTVLAHVVCRYIYGIMSDELRDAVDQFYRTTPHVSLSVVARRHKSLHLAHQFERTLERPHQFTDAADIAHIETYIRALRAPLTRMKKAKDPVTPSCFVPLPPDRPGLLTRVKSLGHPAKREPNKPRDPYYDRLDFPKSGAAGQLCDVNFSPQLALHNTGLLRAYAACDARVRPIVLVVKYWAKLRRINCAYRGSLCSYGYVLMVLHYLINVATPPVCPNLQLIGQHGPDHTGLATTINPQGMPLAADDPSAVCRGQDVRYWRNCHEIAYHARRGHLTCNTTSLGKLLQGFFEYFGDMTHSPTNKRRGFEWGREVLSLRTRHGILTKADKAWTGAKTVYQPRMADAAAAAEDRLPSPATAATPLAATHPPTVTTALVTQEVEVRNRYLLAIEDPFETDHNVARTVTHAGIVAIRDEFRRALRIIRHAGSRAAGMGPSPPIHNHHRHHFNNDHTPPTSVRRGPGQELTHLQPVVVDGLEETADADLPALFLQDTEEAGRVRDAQEFRVLLREIHGPVNGL